MDKQIYGISKSKIWLPLKVLGDKVVSIIDRLTSIWYLGGNVAGATINVLTGNIEIFKEAFAGEHFTMLDILKAEKEYFKYIIPYLISNIGRQVKFDKLSLFIRDFNVLEDNSKDFKDWNIRRSWIRNALGKSIWLPYKAGEHYMQTLPFLALAMKTKIYDKEGVQTSLWDSFYTGNHLYFKTKEGGKTYFMLKDLVDQIDGVLSSTSILDAKIDPDPGQSQYLKEKGYEIKNLEDTKGKLLKDMENLMWSEKDEIDFRDRARIIVNNLHGVYDDANKTAFQQSIYGNSLLSMKGYALGMINRRFAQSRYSAILDTEVGGSLSSTAKMALLPFFKKEHTFLAIRSILLPFGKKTLKEMEKAGLSPSMYYNLRRNWADFAVIALLTILKNMTALEGGGDDDEDDEEKSSNLKGFVYYLATRLLREQEAFNSFRGAKEEASGLLSLTPIGVNFIFDIAKLYNQSKGLLYIEPSDERLSKEEQPEGYIDTYYNSEGEYYTYGTSKAKITAQKHIPYYRFKFVWDSPYTAAEAHEFGKKVQK